MNRPQDSCGDDRIPPMSTMTTLRLPSVCASMVDEGEQGYGQVKRALRAMRKNMTAINNQDDDRVRP